MFKCDCCGLCCMNLSLTSVYADLDRGDGICRYFDCETKLCNIYDKRPELCNIEKMYEIYFKEVMVKDVYYELNYEACKALKKRDNHGVSIIN